MTAIDFAASESHWAQHLGPIASEAFDQGHDVRFFVKAGLERFLPGEIAPITTHPGKTTPDTPITVCSSWVDARNAALRKRRVVLIEHGAGQAYSDRNPSYVGGKGRQHLVGVLVPNQQAAERHLRYYANGPPVRVIGSPRVDQLMAQSLYRPDDRTPLVVCSWHWPCKALPETESAFESMGPAVLAELLDLDRQGEICLYGHSHPRANLPKLTCQKMGIPWMYHFDEVCDMADIYMVDNSSTLFEFAALGRPVVVINSPRYRRRVNHGLRFWEYSTIGPNVDSPVNTQAAIHECVSRVYADRREAMVAEIYPHRGEAARRAVEAIVEWDAG